MIADVNRDLLFGLIALQVGLIDQSQLVAAFQAWVRDKARPLADHLADRGGPDVDGRAAVEAMVALHVKKHGGDTEKSLTSIPAGRSTRERLAALGDPGLTATVSRLASGSTEPDADRTTTYSVGSADSDGQRFRILRPHAQGGLGAVFVALDGELHREVALKQILESHADDPASRRRFLLEAEITGGLEHPGIVPVYGLGTYGDGRPYYAMRFIRGDSLKEAIDQFHRDEAIKADPGRRSLELRMLLRRFTDVCNAIDYAHSRGVLHRDIKPGNVIVGRHGETLVVDWGLAKATGRSEPGSDERTLRLRLAGGSAETLPGSALGTPAYMSPEQARGELERLGPRSDVYSLGATLHCLLTGKPPFEGGDIGVILRAVQEGQFPRPSQLELSLDKALEAVCLKAMATRPEDRYPTSRALADDLERWMADEPVTAWREPLARRARRWVRRNRTAVTGAAVALVAGVVGLTAVLVVQTQANAALTIANTRLEISNRREVKANADLKEANERERSRFALAQEAIQTYHTGVSEDLLLKQKEFGALRTKLLRGARDFYQKLERLLEGHADRESRKSLGRAYREVGELTSELDTVRDALTVHRRALAMFEGLAREDPSDLEVRRDLGMCWLAVGLLLMRQDGGITEGIACLDRAREAFERATAGQASDNECRAELAGIQAYLSDHYLNQGHLETALEVSHQACENWEALVADDAGWVRARFGLAVALDNRGLILKNLTRNEEALETYTKARHLAEELVREFPTDPRYGHELTRILGNMGGCLTDGGRFQEAFVVLTKAREAIRSITEVTPTLLEAQRNLVWIESLEASMLVRTARDEEAIQVLDRVKAGRELLLKANPNEVRHQQQLAWALRTQASSHLTLGRPARARPLSQRALAILEQMADANPGRLDAQVDLADGLCDLGDVEAADGQPAQARGCYEKALAIRKRRVEADPTDGPSIVLLADSFRRIGTTFQASGQPADAVAYYRRSIAMLESLKKSRAQDLYDAACCHSLISGAATAAGSGLSAEAGLAEAERAVAGVRQSFKAGFGNLVWVRTGDPDLKPIRSRPDFQALMMDLAMPADPFVHGQ
jgi:eukaryotic-like serine/threonine-protein kinase